MQISELVERSGIPLARIKFYIREEMLPAGVSTGARRADYGESHLERLRLIHALTNIAGIPFAQAKQILHLIDHPDGSVSDLLGQAISALGGAQQRVHAQHPRADRALASIGGLFDQGHGEMAAMDQLEDALTAAADAGMPVTDRMLRTYAQHASAIAEADVAALPEKGQEAIPYAVLGTALYEPVLAALRRLAHQILVSTR